MDKTRAFEARFRGSNPLGGTKEDVFEQMVRFTLSPQYPWMKELVEMVLKSDRDKIKLT